MFYLKHDPYRLYQLLEYMVHVYTFAECLMQNYVIGDISLR